MEILLDAAINADAYLGIRLAALSELIILAKYAHLWEDHHLKVSTLVSNQKHFKKLQELKAKVDQGPAMILNKYLRILIQISSRMRVNHAVFLQGKYTVYSGTNISRNPLRTRLSLHLTTDSPTNSEHPVCLQYLHLPS